MSAVAPDPVLYSQHGGVVTLTLNRPQQMNALSRSLARRLRECVERAVSASDARVIVIRGAGANFMAGGDLREFQALLQLATEDGKAAFSDLIDDAHHAILLLQQTGKPVVACVHGAVAGFGVGLMAACDLAICADDTFLKLAYSLIGASPDGGATYALPRAMGHKRAMELTLLSDRVDAHTAMRLGLANWVVPADKLDDELNALVERLARGSTGAMAKTKALVHQGAVNTLAQQLSAEQDMFVRGVEAPDFAEGVNAFLARRAPIYRS
ncbi:hypothetical protein UC34_06790 [Pandoraea vervacti]|uniref:Enoyl-CoA hydratase n=1 Tax=Pandoraea vervacti TaxID=656178 RepID=A0ABM5T3K8_9BURK|nr:hypothetical protein UC34_06790 [Pandoraea vervacti]